MSDVLCGPLVRYVDRTSAVLWLELDAYYELTAELQAVVPVGSGSTSFQAYPVKVGSSFYAWIACRFLVPNQWYRYRILGRGRDNEIVQIWPDSGSWRDSLFRTLPSTSLDELRIGFGSCRGGYPASDARAVREGPDALRAYARRLMQSGAGRSEIWPHMMIFTGDQIYGDELSDNLAKIVRRYSSRLHPTPENPTATSFEQYAQVYRESWTNDNDVRWLLSCIPSFMIFDDHDVIDDWNISIDWVEERHNSRAWLKLLTSGLLSYWIYQGAGNLSPRDWRRDRRTRLLTPYYANPLVDMLPRLMREFEQFTLRRRRASWGYSISPPGTQIVVADTRMSRKLTGKRLITDNQAWGEFVTAAKTRRSRRTILVAAGPVLSPRTMHVLLSRAAESIESDPPSTIGAIVGGVVGFVVGGPAGAVVGALAGSAVGEALLDRYMSELLEFADAELWPAFPTSFNRMLSLLEDLNDGVSTNRKSFVGIIAGDVHHSHVIKGDFLKTRRAGSVWHFTNSPLRRSVTQDSRDLLIALDSGALPYSADVLLPLEKPSFVDDQFARLDWYPLTPEGRRAAYEDVETWDFFGKFVGQLELGPANAIYTYFESPGPGLANPQLRQLTQQTIPAI